MRRIIERVVTVVTTTTWTITWQDDPPRADHQTDPVAGNLSQPQLSSLTQPFDQTDLTKLAKEVGPTETIK